MHFESAAKNRTPSVPGSQDVTKPPFALKNAQSRSTSSQEINDRLVHDTPPSVRRPTDSSPLIQGLSEPLLGIGKTAPGRAMNSDQCFLDVKGLRRESEALRTFDIEMPKHAQGLENSCGTTSLAMSMAYLGVPADFRIIDRSTRMFDPDEGVGTAPQDMVDFARRSGLQAEQYNDGSLEQLVSHVRGGRPVTVLLNFEDATAGMAHYLNVIGFERDGAGQIENVVMLNPWGRVDRLSLKDFMQQWSNVALAREGVMAALPTYNRLMVVLDHPENPPLPQPNMSGALKAATTNTMMNGVSGLSAGIETIKRGEAVAGGAQ
ncbi:MAG: C39 family peptidase, partial [Myxococcota bacterium]|nr:C39 family peptidase [Myxococcota bacterium]